MYKYFDMWRPLQEDRVAGSSPGLLIIWKRLCERHGKGNAIRMTISVMIRRCRDETIDKIHPRHRASAPAGSPFDVRLVD